MKRNKSKKYKKIAIVGGIGSGKSTIINLLTNDFQKKVCSADELNRELLNKKEYIEKIQRVFPDVIVDGQIDRVKLGNIVFNDPESLAKLNSLAHVEIAQMLENVFKDLKEDIFVEISAYNDRIMSFFDEVWFIDSDEMVRFRRSKRRDGRSDEYINSIIQAQREWLSIFKDKADVILYNNTSLEDVSKQIEQRL